MKATIKTVLLLGVLGILLGSCFDPPEYSNTPQIEFQSVRFKEIGTNSDMDSLIITISFKDGDGDLGLSSTETTSPYHEQDFFLDKNGKLITVRTTSADLDPGDVIPPFEDPYSCLNYLYDSLFVSDQQKTAFDNTYNVIDTFRSGNMIYYTLLDTFYIEKNPNHYNITVEFLTKEGNTFKTFDWRTVYGYPTCGETFDGRFPILKEGNSHALEGTLTYGMRSNGFLPLLGSKTLKLRVTIKDRALNSSNTVESPEFTLR